MAYYEKRGSISCVPDRSHGWRRGSAVLELVNQQHINKVVVRPAGQLQQTAKIVVKLFASEKAAASEVYLDDDLHLVMPPLEGNGQVTFFDVVGYTFQDADTGLQETFGKLRLVIEAEDVGDMAFLYAVGGDVPGAVTHGATVFLS